MTKRTLAAVGLLLVFGLAATALLWGVGLPWVTSALATDADPGYLEEVYGEYDGLDDDEGVEEIADGSSIAGENVMEGAVEISILD